MENEQNSGAVYIVTVNGENRKAIDIMFLKQYLMDKRAQHSLLSPKEGASDLYKEIANAALETLYELESAIDQALGLVEKAEPESEPEIEVPEIEEEKEPVKQVVEEAKPVQKEAFNKEAETEDRIVL